MNGFILAGGQSTRMGRDKAWLEIEGRPLIQRAVETLRSLDLHPRICGSRPDLARFAAAIPDGFPGCGPLAGIEAALAVSDSELNLFCPVDVPSLPPAFLRWMIERAQSGRAVATIPRFADRLQPLCAIYSRRLHEGLRNQLALRSFKVMAAVQAAAAAQGEAIDIFQVESVAAALPPGCWPSDPPLREWFRNLNTPEEWEGLRRLTRGAPVE